jgi:hypothetical protein
MKIKITNSLPLEKRKASHCLSHCADHFNPGDLLNKRYEIVTKVGWGTTSTVWLARDTQQYVLA